MPEKPVTRIDLERDGSDVVIRMWYEGWIEGEPSDLQDRQPNAYLVGLLMRYEAQGYTCEMCDQDHGRALRGKTTRVDLVQMPDGWHIKKFPYGWTARTRPISDEIKTAEEVETAVTWFEDHGWNVRRWPGGYRAFRGTPQPVRDRASILTMRRKVESDMAMGRPSADNRSQFDFALDF